MQFDDLLRNHLGECGRYQVVCLVALTMGCFVSALNTMEIVFMTQTPPYWCTEPTVKERYLSNSTSDLALDGNPLDGTNGTYDACQVHNGLFEEYPSLDNETLNMTLTNASISKGHCSAWTFDTQGTETLVSHWSLVCGRQWLGSMAKSVYFMGQMPGVILSGLAADRFGRRTAIIAVFVLDIIMRIIMITSPVIEVFLVARFFSGGLELAFGSCTVVQMVEMVGPRYRATSIVTADIIFNVGYTLSSLTAFLVPHWKYLQITNTVVSFIAGFGVFFIPESPRWLFAVGRNEEGTKVVRRMAQINHKELSPGIHLKITADLGKKEKKISWKETLRSCLFISRLSATMWLWFSVAMIYYGVAMNVGNLYGNIYINSVIMGAIGILGIILTKVMSDSRLGRRNSMVISFGICGIAFLGNVAFSGPHIGQTILSITGRVAIGIAFNIVYISTTEVFPTAMRNSTLGTASMIGRIGSSLCPFIILSSAVYIHLPDIIFAATSLISAVLCFALPETLGRELPTSLQDMNKMHTCMCPCLEDHSVKTDEQEETGLTKV